MEIVVTVIMLLVMLGFILKLTWHGLIGRSVLALVCALFIGLVWEYAAGQSKTQIAAWLQEPELMLDTSVLLTVDVFFQPCGCWDLNSGPLEEQSVLLTTEPSLQPQACSYVCI